MTGLVHIYTGDGKGKTTAALGLGMRACGRGLKVLMVQFLKGMETGEVYAIEKLSPGFVLYRRTELKKFTRDMNEEERETAKNIQREILDYAVQAAQTGQWDLLILDEVIVAVTTGLLPLKDVADFIKEKPKGLEVVITGRNAPPELVSLADYVSDIRAVKHPMNKGVPARKGIES